MVLRGHRARRPAAALGFVLVLIGAACGGSGGSSRGSVPDADSTTVVTTKTPTSGGRESRPYDAHLRRTIRSIQAFWKEQLPAVYNVDYKSLSGGLFGYTSKSKIPPCGEQRLSYLVVQNNAFYCAESDFVAWDDEKLFPQLAKQSGDFLLSVVLAHEWGHVVQDRRGDADGFLEGALVELQADCFAGAWVAHVRAEETALGFSDEELDRVLAGYVGFRDRPGVAADDPDAHGSAFDRVGSFRRGLLEGADRCATYDDEPPELVQIPFINLRDRFSGGNAPFDEVVPLATASLKVFFEDDPVVERSTAKKLTAECNGDVEMVRGSGAVVHYCPADDTIRWSASATRRVYDRYGDFAVATLLSEAWARRRQVQEGTAKDTTSSRLQADCLAGAWAGAAFRGDAGPIRLTAGDLDEAIVTLLELRQEKGDEMTRGGAFDRVDAYQSGFEAGVGTCTPEMESIESPDGDPPVRDPAL